MDPLPVARLPGETTLIEYLSARPLSKWCWARIPRGGGDPERVKSRGCRRSIG
jgi:hypothetical protein